MKPDSKYSIIVTDDHPLVTTGLKAVINEQQNLEVTGTADSAAQLFRLLEEDVADLIILDISMPEMDGVETARIIRKKRPRQKILCISTFYRQSLYSTLQSIPVQGFIPKLTDTKVIVESINKILKGEKVFITRNEENPETNKLILTEIIHALTKREIEIMKLIKEGKQTKEIATTLFIAEDTVGTHRKNICKKLGITSHNGLVRFAVENF